MGYSDYKMGHASAQARESSAEVTPDKEVQEDAAEHKVSESPVCARGGTNALVDEGDSHPGEREAEADRSGDRIGNVGLLSGFD